jgi:protein-tyrosine-phosphatase
MHTTSYPPLRLLFLCTGNSARSQIAEALLTTKGKGKFIAGSAGVQPASAVNPYALDELRSCGIDWSHARPRSIDDVFGEPWDIIITVCDNARESCPVFPGQPTAAHWGVPDPAMVEGSEAEKRRAFRDTTAVLGRRIDLLLALPAERLRGLTLARDLDQIGGAGRSPGT